MAVNTIMKIQELMNQTTPQTKNEFQSPNSDILGSGMQAKVYQHPNHTDRVVKVVKLFNPRTDAYTNFVRLIVKHQDNPFFPRIFSAKIHEMPNDADGALPYRLIIVMEKLHPVDSEKLQDATIESLWRLGINTDSWSDDELYDAVLNVKMAFNNSDRRKKLAAETNNPQFKEALELLEPYFEAFGTDMHIGNIMIRLTGSGPQIVLIDPLDFG